MAYATLHNVIRARFNTEITSGESVSTAWDNAAFRALPSSGTGKWVRFSIRNGSSRQAEMSPAGRHRTVGVAVAQIFVPIDSGDGAALALADSIVSAFRGVTVTESGHTVIFDSPSVGTIGKDGAWWQLNVDLPYYTDNA